MFTQKHYEVLASLLGESEDITTFQEKLMLYLEMDNKKFNPVLFIKRKLGIKPTRAEVLYPSQYEGCETKY